MPEDTRILPPSQGIIWKIDRNATHDGPGIRTTLYFKGCPLRCKWCSNPEGQTAEPILVFLQSKCNDCGICLDACPVRALQRRGPAEIQIHRSRCDRCEDCVSKCPTEALQIWGRSYTVQEVLGILEKDRMIHRKSGGGLTCTGGEPFAQGEFLLALIDECSHQGIHTAVETCAYADDELFRRVIECVDLLFIDIKQMDPGRHLELTGKNNDLILAHTRLASSALKDRGKALIVRQVVVPGITDGRNTENLGDFLAGLPFLSGVELLAYHNYGVQKYELRGVPYTLEEIKQPGAEEMEECKRVLRGKGLTVA